jgi:hypothetical protein
LRLTVTNPGAQGRVTPMKHTKITIDRGRLSVDRMTHTDVIVDPDDTYGSSAGGIKEFSRGERLG